MKSACLGLFVGFLSLPFHPAQAELNLDRLKEKAPELHLVLDEKPSTPLDLSHESGKPMILHFWASWCDACKDELPELIKLKESLGPHWAFVAISVDETASKKEEARHFIQNLKVKTPLYFLAQGENAKKYVGWGVPVTYFIQADGTIVARAVGRRPWLEAFSKKDPFFKNLK